MNRIDGLNSTLEILRRKIRESAAELDRTGKHSGTRDTGSTRSVDLTAVSELRNGVRERIRALDPEDEQYRTKATRIFLESVLLREFGGEAARDDRFAELVDKVRLAMESHPDTRDRLQELFDQLAR